ncbi:hypothetical protein SAMN02745135_02383 [Caloranaerobacter azorensis DSM 13643]|uniref:Uncharacterized protein n=1 Tax=Caloranaerobacter azorensis DSM 13643 TaxID=1121264 RepID=A0A1M5WAK7_9FIRM|nr:hypothetical protein [Caloranaerobacter azorensis]SHH84609.1 hypothetical protein SAMN02745135_02383 [Caloranaerobacter azorensis DSM 13643]
MKNKDLEMLKNLAGEKIGNVEEEIAGLVLCDCCCSSKNGG